MRIRTLLGVVLLSCWLAAPAHAITISATPNPATTSQNVAFTIVSVLPSTTTTCTLTIDYGDGTIVPGVSLGTPLGTGPVTFTASAAHAYATAGNFTVVVQSAGCGAVAAGPAAPDPASLSLGVAAAAGSSLTITRLELAFPDGKGQTTVRRNEHGLRATATVATTGSGLLQGYWEADGRVLSRVDQYVTFGQTVKLETPTVPSLPTFDPGTHLLRFVITSPQSPQQNRFAPSASGQVPTLLYTVTPEERRPIQLQGPLPEAVLHFAPASFGWQAQLGVGHYQLRFLATDGTPFFAALTKSPDYRLTELALHKYFTPGTRYLWQVQAFDGDGQLMGESQPATFSFQGTGANP